MLGIIRSAKSISTRRLRARGTLFKTSYGGQLGNRYASDTISPPSKQNRAESDSSARSKDANQEKERGAMSRLLQEMSEKSLETGGKSARNAIEEAGFSEELKRQLEERIASASFRSENASAFAEVNMPTSADKHTRNIAAAAPWTGTESVEDASLRMLTDVHKPLRGAPKVPGVRGPPAKVDTGRPRSQVGAGNRIASARDRSSFYAFVKDAGLSEEERDKFRQQMKQRFQPAARAVPATLQGLASLANERIEDAIARGQFKNLPRGKKIERDHNASSPFINTTEYFMNKMIQKQEIVPPWIEKQQELVATATRFRSRLRADWKRHVARVLASRGGTLESQIKLANDYARAERVHNPRKNKVEQINTVDDSGHISQITIAGDIKPRLTNAEQPEDREQIKVVERPLNDDGSTGPPEQQLTITADHQSGQYHSQDSESRNQPNFLPFRDTLWEETERSYQTLAIENLNSLTRTYNLMAPNLAKKPYFLLERELQSCFADVAPQVAAAIKERALAPKIQGIEVIGHKPGGVLEKFSMDRAGHVYDERRPQYGFKEFWRDLFTAKT